MEKRETVGKAAYDRLIKTPELVDPIEQQRMMQEDYEKNFYQCLEQAKKDMPGEIYIVVITKNEKLMPNVFRNYFLARSTCPTPDYDQTVYKYKRDDDSIDFLWVIPSRDACLYLRANKTQVVPGEWALLNFVLQFDEGKLYELSKKLNGEQKDNGFLEGVDIHVR